MLKRSKLYLSEEKTEINIYQIIHSEDDEQNSEDDIIQYHRECAEEC